MKNNKGHSTVEAVLLTIFWIAIMILSGIGAISSLIWGADKMMQRQEKSECQKWDGEAKEYPDYYQTDWQVEQCARYNIVIDAPIK